MVFHFVFFGNVAAAALGLAEHFWHVVEKGERKRDGQKGSRFTFCSRLQRINWELMRRRRKSKSWAPFGGENATWRD